ncbi:RNB domain-containing ribonuclease [Gordonia sp. TBRC 11910]|uniref:RNB domain-containing ribonuclease n=1 Tax=Gordonia asplenii TaxID=2725283 RepID=A0A848KQA7_9ACTN|nr:RNB domain-containing ribonuclease [Gordonia asplenii]NMO01194.1 RNB domain-containing ribonuclease [Gordonia asplenii]
MQRRVSAPDIDFDAIRAELGISEEYGAQAQDEAEHIVDAHAGTREDHTALPFVTIDPPTSMDLDQAVHLTTDADGYVVDYAIADVGALVVPEGELDQESRRRGTTYYFPDGSVPLHPRALSEGAGSLLPDQVRPAVLWTIRVDHAGAVVDVKVRRSTVRSVAKLNYAGVSADAASGTLHPSIAALPEFGDLRRRAGLERGAIDLDLPEQDVVRDASGAWTLQLAPRYDSDLWNAQLSLLTGMCAGTIMRDAGIGLLRTVPPAAPDAVAKVRALATALGLSWPVDQPAGKFLSGLPDDAPTTLAMMAGASGLLRGSDYLALPADSTPTTTEHAGVGGAYAHVTAPLRRLGDRFATEVCLSVTTGVEIPEWVRSALPTLPKLLRSADALGSKADRLSIDLAESVVLADEVGNEYDAVVTHAPKEQRPAQIFLADHAVIAPCTGDLVPAQQLRVRLVLADPSSRKVEFEPV